MNVTVVGVGYVGLVTGACLAEVGNSVCCVDSDLQKIEQLQRGIIPIYEPGLGALVNRGTESERLFFTNDLTDGISFADLIIIAVGTPQSTDGSADLQHVSKLHALLAMVLRASRSSSTNQLFLLARQIVFDL